MYAACHFEFFPRDVIRRGEGVARNLSQDCTLYELCNRPSEKAETRPPALSSPDSSFRSLVRGFHLKLSDASFDYLVNFHTVYVQIAQWRGETPGDKSLEMQVWRE
jgi:hypothetical protein